MEFYIVKPGDTLASISSSQGIPIEKLEELNNYINDIRPGERLMLRNSELSLTNEVHYCTRLGKVRGMLTITEHVILFDPLRKGETCEIKTLDGTEQGDAHAFQTFIDFNDVIHFNVVELQGNRGSEQLFFLEFMLSRTGREKRGKRSDIPKVNVYFKLAIILSSGEKQQYLTLKTKADQILALVSASLQQVDRTREDSGTFVPFYDINKAYLGRLNSGLEELDEDEEFKEIVREMMSEEGQQQELLALPEMNGESQIFTPKIINQIHLALPNVFQHRQWKLIYSTLDHGRSLHSFYHRVEGCGPNVLIVKDSNKFVFGGYFTCSWRKGYEYYGSGESFLFTFRNSERMKIFYPTLANDCYMRSDNQSLIIGSGGNAGIYIDGGFESGTSGKSKTYNNQVLSSDPHFQIVELEVWALVGLVP